MYSALLLDQPRRSWRMWMSDKLMSLAEQLSDVGCNGDLIDKISCFRIGSSLLLLSGITSLCAKVFLHYLRHRVLVVVCSHFLSVELLSVSFKLLLGHHGKHVISVVGDVVTLLLHGNFEPRLQLLKTPSTECLKVSSR